MEAPKARAPGGRKKVHKRGGGLGTFTTGA